MIDDPYKVLGVERDASKEEIKRAYRKKAKEYHPDLHPDDPHAAEKMNEINEAYDMLQNPEKYQRRTSQSSSGQGGFYGNTQGQGQWKQGQQSTGGYGGYSGGYGGFGGFGDFGDFEDLFGFGRYSQTPPNPTVEPQDREEIRQVIELINRKQYAGAASILNNIVSGLRDARWFYLSSLTNFGQGNQILALGQIQKALQLEPNNSTYKATMQSMQYSGTTYQQSGWDFQEYSNSMNRMCMGMCLANIFCNCCC